MEFGLATLVHDLKHRRYRFRQALGGIMVVFLVILAQPAPRGLPIGVAVCILGEMVRLWAAGYVRKSRVLETRGPYAFVRHPQYLGNTLHAVGLCLASGHPWAISVWPVFFLLFYMSAIRREDGKLENRFGDDWRAWREVTPAVIPRRWPGRKAWGHLREWSLLQSIRNGEPLWVMGISAALVLMYLGLP